MPGVARIFVKSLNRVWLTCFLEHFNLNLPLPTQRANYDLSLRKLVLNKIYFPCDFTENLWGRCHELDRDFAEMIDRSRPR